MAERQKGNPVTGKRIMVKDGLDYKSNPGLDASYSVLGTYSNVLRKR